MARWSVESPGIKEGALPDGGPVVIARREMWELVAAARTKRLKELAVDVNVQSQLPALGKRALILTGEAQPQKQPKLDSQQS